MNLFLVTANKRDVLQLECAEGIRALIVFQSKGSNGLPISQLAASTKTTPWKGEKKTGGKLQIEFLLYYNTFISMHFTIDILSSFNLKFFQQIWMRHTPCLFVSANSLRSRLHAGSCNALENFLNLGCAAGERVVPESVGLVLDQLDKSNQKTPRMRPMQDQSLKEDSGNLFFHSNICRLAE